MAARSASSAHSLEGFFSIFKPRTGWYLAAHEAEFDFRMNTRAKLGINDMPGTKQLVKGKSLAVIEQSAFDWMLKRKR